ncbi:hypothetical protein [Shouchella lonarensis]|nr:hypothetical protein [Shouchella lonarensis]
MSAWILIPLAALLIPITAIMTDYAYKRKRLEMQDNAGLENAELYERIEQLEAKLARIEQTDERRRLD